MVAIAAVAALCGVVGVGLLLAGNAHPDIYALEGDSLRLYDSSSPATILRSGDINEIATIEDGVVVAHGFGADREITAFLDGDRAVTLSRDLGEPHLQSNRSDHIAYETEEGVMLQQVSDGAVQFVVPHADSWILIPRSTTIAAARGGEVLLHTKENPEGTLIARADAVVGAVEHTIYVENAETYLSVDTMTEEVLPLLTVTDGGHLDDVQPYWGGTIQTYSQSDAGDLQSMTVYSVSDEGEGTLLWTTSAPGAVVQACAYRNGEYVAISYGDDVPANYLDSYERSYPAGLSTAIVRVSDVSLVTTIEGSHPSWCQTSPLWWQHPDAHVHDH